MKISGVLAPPSRHSECQIALVWRGAHFEIALAALSRTCACQIALIVAGQGDFFYRGLRRDLDKRSLTEILPRENGIIVYSHVKPPECIFASL